jgi:hypothetical protein
MMRTSSLLVLALLCAAGAMANDDFASREEAAMAVTQSLFEEISAALQHALQTEGPEGAIGVCRDLASAIKQRLSLETGARVTRVGTRVRNPLLGLPDAWERAGLDDFERRRAAGESMVSMTRSAVVKRSDGRYFRFMRAIGVQPACLSCHGAPETIPTSVREQLDRHYPQDRATGYAAGELRGAFSITEPLDDVR